MNNTEYELLSKEQFAAKYDELFEYVGKLEMKLQMTEEGHTSYEEAYDQGYADGESQGYADGESQGYADGFNAALDEVCNTGL